MTETSPQTHPQPKKKLPVVPFLIIIVALVAAGLYGLLRDGEKVRESVVEGRLVYVDPASRMASMEIQGLKGKAGTSEISGRIPQACVITINDEPAGLEQLRIGDRVRVKGRVRRGAEDAEGKREVEVTAEWIKVSREETTSPPGAADGDQPAPDDEPAEK